jgi:hypothetical protein
MTIHDYEELLKDARAVLDRYLFDGELLRDDVAAICMKIDDVLSEAPVAERTRTGEETIEEAA